MEISLSCPALAEAVGAPGRLDDVEGDAAGRRERAALAVAAEVAVARRRRPEDVQEHGPDGVARLEDHVAGLERAGEARLAAGPPVVGEHDALRRVLREQPQRRQQRRDELRFVDDVRGHDDVRRERVEPASRAAVMMLQYQRGPLTS